MLVFDQQMLIFHWENIGLEPTGAFIFHWYYVLRREFAVFAKKVDFSLEICVKSRGGRAARCMGTPPVAEMLASEAFGDNGQGDAHGGGAMNREAQSPRHIYVG